jgi:hypothetical protein
MIQVEKWGAVQIVALLILNASKVLENIYLQP